MFFSFLLLRQNRQIRGFFGIFGSRIILKYPVIFKNQFRLAFLIDTDVVIDLVYQIGGDGFDSLKQDDVEEVLVNEPFTDIDIISLVTDNEKNLDSEESDSED